MKEYYSEAVMAATVLLIAITVGFIILPFMLEWRADATLDGTYLLGMFLGATVTGAWAYLLSKRTSE